MRQIIPLLTSAVTIFGMWLAGNKDPRAWIVGLANQSLWLLFIFVFHAWGLLPLAAALIMTYSRNLRKWRAETAPT